MSEEFSLDDAQTLRSYIQWMGQVEDDLRSVSSYVSTTVCSTEAYPPLMEPVADALRTAANLYRWMTDEAVEKWQGTEQVLFDIGRAYQQEDGEVMKFFRQSDMEREIEMIQKANENRRRKIDEQMGPTI